MVDLGTMVLLSSGTAAHSQGMHGGHKALCGGHSSFCDMGEMCRIRSSQEEQGVNSTTDAFL